MSNYNPEIHHRRSIRLNNYDYSQPGAYFVTVTTYQREPLFGKITDTIMNLNNIGMIIQSCWEQIPCHFVNVQINAFGFMPDHFHGVLILDGKGTACRAPTEYRFPIAEIF